jgi:hypothetical protein
MGGFGRQHVRELEWGFTPGSEISKRGLLDMNNW